MNHDPLILDVSLMQGAMLLTITGLVLRLSGASLRLGYSGFSTQIWGGLLCAVAAWLVASALGAWSPVWPVLVIGLVGALMSYLRRGIFWIQSGTDVLVVLTAGLWSIPPMRIEMLGLAVIVMASAGLAADAVISRFTRPVVMSAMLLPLFALTLFGVARPWTLVKTLRQLQKNLPYDSWPHVGLTPVQSGNRTVLQTGAVAWLDVAQGNGPFPGALLFHGANPLGSRQSSAVVIRRALLDAGFLVLSIDHPGYGESPVPSPRINIEAWDSTPTARAGLDSLRNVKGINHKQIFVLGHSMGTYDVFRVLRTNPDIAHAITFGAALNFPSDEDEYWYERFHADRRMGRRISREMFNEIRGRFYDNLRTVQTVDPHHVPVLFVRFGLEWAHLAATRDILYKAIPGPKTTWDLPQSSHYFNSLRVGGLIVGDTRVGGLLAAKFRSLAALARHVSRNGAPVVASK